MALKHIFFQVLQRGEDAAQVRDRQSRELAALRAVAHPNVVQLLDVLPQVEAALRCLLSCPMLFDCPHVQRNPMRQCA